MHVPGKRVKIRWAERDYPGTVGVFNEDSKLHTIHYDDGDVKASSMVTKVWSVIA